VRRAFAEIVSDAQCDIDGGVQHESLVELIEIGHVVPPSERSRGSLLQYVAAEGLDEAFVAGVRQGAERRLELVKRGPGQAV